MVRDPVLSASWRALVDATTRRTPFTLAALATVDAAGSPRVRSVILRACDPDAGVLSFATDARSAKVAEIRGNPRVALSGYDEAAGVQLRLEGRALVVADAAERRRRWDSLGEHTRRSYGSSSVPGTSLPAGGRPAGPDEDERVWFERFAWVEVTVDLVDRVDVSADPLERAVFERTATGWIGERLVP